MRARADHERIDVTHATWKASEPTFRAIVDELVGDSDVRRVCDIGGGANPALAPEVVGDLGIDYTVLDVSATELAKAAPTYQRVVADITGPLPDLGPFDLVVSHMLAEHIADPARMHGNIAALLRPDGYAVHLFPTLHDPAFLLNRAMPEGLAGRLLGWLQPHRTPEGTAAKFPAFYRWCRGPTPRQLRRFRDVGFEVVAYHAFYGTGYLARIGALRPVNLRIAEALARFGNPHLTSYAVVVLRRV